MFRFPWAGERVRSFWCAAVAGASVAAVLAGVSLPSAVAGHNNGGYGNGGYGNSGYFGGGYYGGGYYGGGYGNSGYHGSGYGNSGNHGTGYGNGGNYGGGYRGGNAFVRSGSSQRRVYVDYRPVQKAEHQSYAPQKYVAPKHVVQNHTLLTRTATRTSQRPSPQNPATRVSVAPEPMSPALTSVVQSYGLPKQGSASESETLLGRRRGQISTLAMTPSTFISTRDATSVANRDTKASGDYARDHHHHHYWYDPGWYDVYWRPVYWHHYFDDGYAWYTTGWLYDYRAARRQLVIDNIQEQIGAAQQVLEDAVAREEMSEKQLDEAHQRVLKARAAMDSAAAEELQRNRRMREIEARLISEQRSGSELVQAQAKVDAAREALDREVHRVLSLPLHAGKPTAADYAHEVAMLMPGQKEDLKKDAGFRHAAEALRAAVREAVQVRQALFEKDSSWSAAKQVAVEAEQQRRKANNDLARDAGLSQLAPKRELHAAQDLAAEARVTIAVGKAALRSLGAQVPAG